MAAEREQDRNRQTGRESVGEGMHSPDSTEAPLRAKDARPDERTREEAGGADRSAGQARKPAPREGLSAKDIEAMETDGKGTGGTGADAGGYGSVPGSDSTG